MMKKVVSLLLALVMALGLCTSAIAETNGESEDVQTGNETYTMETVLAGVDALTGNEAEKTAIKDYLNTYFVVVDNENGFFFVINNVGLRRDKFIQTQEQKVTVQNAVDGYNAQIGDTNRSIAAILDAYQVKYGNGTRTFGDLMGMYTAALKRPAVQINEGSNGPDTGKVEGTHLLKSSDGTDYLYNNAEYITTADANAAIEYFNKYFTYRTWELGNGSEYNTVTYSDSIYDKETDKITDEAKAKEASVYKGYKRDKIEMRGDRAEISDFPLYLNTVAGGLDRRDQTIGGFSFVVKIYALPVVEISSACTHAGISGIIRCK